MMSLLMKEFTAVFCVLKLRHRAEYLVPRGLVQKFVHGWDPSAWPAIGAYQAILPSPDQG